MEQEAGVQVVLIVSVGNGTVVNEQLNIRKALHGAGLFLFMLFNKKVE